MKKVLVTIFIFVALTITQAFAYNLKTFTSDSTILAAMEGLLSLRFINITDSQITTRLITDTAHNWKNPSLAYSA